MKLNEIRDPIYGFVTFNDFEKSIINSPVFQRLRRINQLALTQMVYPGAQHTRFEHSIGVMHLATKMFDSIINNKKNLELLKKRYKFEKEGLKKDRQLLRIAALLHDIGHGPFSHGSEEIFPRNKAGKQYSHEDYSVAIIKILLKDLIEDNQYNRNNCSITAEEVAGFIEGNLFLLKDRIFWKTLLSSQLDADRGDYLLRDSYHIGVKYGIYDIERLLVTTTLGINPEDNYLMLGIHEDGWHVAEALILARYQVYSQIVLHKKRRVFDLMLNSALKEVIDKIPPPTSKKNLEKFIDLDDIEIWSRMKKSKKFWSRAILNRNHLKCVYANENLTIYDDSIVETIKSRFADENILPVVDSEDRDWYRLKKDAGKTGEIMIIGEDRKARPLSHYSTIINNMKDSRQIRIYVKSEDLSRSGEIVNEVCDHAG